MRTILYIGMVPRTALPRPIPRSIRYAAGLTVLGVLGVAACASNGASTTSTVAGSATATSRIDVVATTTQISDFVHEIGGDHANVYSVLSANLDPHDYEPTAADLQAISAARVIVINGVDLERWFAPTIASAAPHGTIVDASTGIEIRKADAPAGESAGDPHIWHNPQNAKIMVRNIADALTAADPADAEAFRSNLLTYTNALDQLDSELRDELATLANRKIVTNHDAFGYYIDHYHLDYVGSVIPSFDTQAELSPTDITDLVAKIKAQGVKAVFSESSLPPKTAAAIAKEAGVKVIEGEDALYGDTLGPKGSDGDTYLKMERHNTHEIIAALT